MPISKLTDNCVRALLSKFTLHKRLYFRSVSRQWKSVAESMCLEIRCLKILGIADMNEPDYCVNYIPNLPQEDQALLKPKQVETLTEGNLVVVSTRLTEKFAKFLARLMPNLEHLIAGFDMSCKVASVNYLLEQWPRLARLSLYGQIEMGSKIDLHQRRHRVVELIETKANLTQLDLLLYYVDLITYPEYCIILNYELSGELCTVMPRLTRFSIAQHDKRAFGIVLKKLGPQCSYLRIDNCEFGISELKALRCAPSLTYFRARTEVTQLPNVLPVICDRFKALQTLDLSINQIKLDLNSIGQLAQLSHLSSLSISDVFIALDIKAPNKDFKPLVQVNSLTMYKLKLTTDAKSQNGDLLCRTLAFIFPAVEQFTFDHGTSFGITDKTLKHFPLLKKH